MLINLINFTNFVLNVCIHASASICEENGVMFHINTKLFTQISMQLTLSFHKIVSLLF